MPTSRRRRRIKGRPGARHHCSLPLRLLLGTLVLFQPTARAAVVDVTFNVTHAFRSLDGVERLVILVNGQIPGPAIRCTKGDKVRVRVNNQMTGEETLSLHWHGLWMRGAPYMDGTSLSQCPIAAGDSFLYELDVGDQAGTFMYHGHLDSMQRADGAYGAFIVDDPAPPPHLAYDEERTIILSDWYHQDGRTLAAGLGQQPFRWVGDPQSILHNGKGNFSCPSDASGATATSSCTPQTPAQGFEQILVEPGKTYLLRLISATSLSLLDFGIEGHNLTVVEADGNYVQPYEVTHVPVNSGERYSVLLKAKTQAELQGQQQRFWVGTETRMRALVKGHAVLQYATAPGQRAERSSSSLSSRRTPRQADGGPALVLPPTPAEAFVHPGTWSAEILETQKQYMLMLKNGTAREVWGPLQDRVYRLEAEASIDWIRGLKALPSSSAAAGDVLPTQPQAERSLSLVQHQCRTSPDGTHIYTPYDPVAEAYDNTGAGGVLRWCLNNRTSQAATAPLLLDLLADGGVDGASAAADGDDLVVPLRRGEVVDVLIQNSRALNNVSEQHPWHLHGHSFWVLGHGMGRFDPARDMAALNLVDPPYRDMVTVFPFGWTLIRFKADNVGVFPLHCHVESHALMGMAVVFIEDPPALARMLPPEGYGLCGRVAAFTADKAALFFRGVHGGMGPSPWLVPLLAVVMALSLSVNLVLLARAPHTRRCTNGVVRRILSIQSPRQQEAAAITTTAISSRRRIPKKGARLPIASPIGGIVDEEEDDGDIEMPPSTR